MNNSIKFIFRAAIFASRAHKRQKRKYTGEPYFNHCLEVASLVAQVHGSVDMICAALLHDVVEDTKITLRQIEEEFNREIANLVYWLTDQSKPEDGNREQRKAIDKDHIALASKEAKTIKLADMISNISSIVKRDPDFAEIYMAEKRELLSVLSDAESPQMFYEAKRIISEYYDIKSKL